MSARDGAPHRPASDAAAGARREPPRSSSESPRLEAVVDRVGAIAGRLTRVWRALPSERRLAGFAAIGLFATLFLPWYQETVIARGVTSLRSLSDSLTGWGAFSFVEAAVLLVAAGVLLLLFVRAEGEAFHVPGGDGGVITAAGAWACVLIIWRMFDKEGTTGHGLYSTSSGIEWGIFVALAVAGLLTYAGTRIRLAHDPEPPLPGERPRRRRRLGVEGLAPDRSATPAAPPASGPDWVAEDDIEETWLQLADLPRRTPPRRRAPTGSTPAGTRATPRHGPPAPPPMPRPAPAGDANATPAGGPRRRPPLTAAPRPRRRRRRSIAEPPAPSTEDQATLPLDHRN